MNKRRLAGIARWLERGAKPKGGVEGFDMNEWFGGCVCICGAADAWWGGRGGDEHKIAELLGVSFRVVRQIAYPAIPGVFTGGAGEIGSNRLWGARMLRRLIATGEVDWAGTREAPPKEKRK